MFFVSASLLVKSERVLKLCAFSPLTSALVILICQTRPARRLPGSAYLIVLVLRGPIPALFRKKLRKTRAKDASGHTV